MEETTHILTLRDYIDILRRQSWYVILPTLAALLVSALMAPENLAIYSTQAKILIQDAGTREPLFKDLTTSFRSEYSLPTQMEVLRSRPLAEDVASEVELRLVDQARRDGSVEGLQRLMQADDKAKLVQDNFSIEPLYKANMLVLHFKSPAPEMTVNLARATCDVYLRESLRARTDRMQAARRFINEQLDLYHIRTVRLEKELGEFKRENRFKTVSVGIEKFNNTDKLYASTHVDLEIGRARLGEVRGQIEAMKENVVSMDEYQSPILEKLRTSLVELETRKALDLRFKTEAHPDIETLNEEIGGTQAVLMGEIRALMREEAEVDPLSHYRQLTDEALKLEMELASLETRKAALAGIMDQYLEELPTLADKEIELIRRQYEINVARKTYEKFLDKQNEVNQALEMERGEIRVVEPPVATQVSRSFKKYRTVAASGFLGLLVGVGLAFIVDHNDTSLKNLRDIKRYLGMSVLGGIPKTRLSDFESAGEFLDRFEKSSSFAEAFRTVRTNLEFRTIEKPARVNIITSAVPGEGKTTVLINLALAMVQKRQRVLVIDADLRRPGLHKRFGTARSPGLTEILTEPSHSLKDVVQPTTVPNLDFLPSGSLPPNPSEILSSERMQIIIDQMGEMYDSVFLDSPAVLPVTDAAVLAPMVDGVLFVVREQEAGRETIQEAVDIIRGTGSTILGSITTRVTRLRPHYYYYYHSPKQSEA